MSVEVESKWSLSLSGREIQSNVLSKGEKKIFFLKLSILNFYKHSALQPSILLSSKSAIVNIHECSRAIPELTSLFHLQTLNTQQTIMEELWSQVLHSMGLRHCASPSQYLIAELLKMQHFGFKRNWCTWQEIIVVKITICQAAKKTCKLSTNLGESQKINLQKGISEICYHSERATSL